LEGEALEGEFTLLRSGDSPLLRIIRFGDSPLLRIIFIGFLDGESYSFAITGLIISLGSLSGKLDASSAYSVFFSFFCF